MLRVSPIPLPFLAGVVSAHASEAGGPRFHSWKAVFLRARGYCMALCAAYGRVFLPFGHVFFAVGSRMGTYFCRLGVYFFRLLAFGRVFLLSACVLARIFAFALGSLVKTDVWVT